MEALIREVRKAGDTIGGVVSCVIQNCPTGLGEPAVVTGKGRHDPCMLPRAVPIVEAMAALVVVEHLLRQRGARV
ncbi:MAG: chorismate synthase [Saprospiraceae bacterium]